MLSAGGGAEVSDAFSQRASRIAGSDHCQTITRPIDTSIFLLKKTFLVNYSLFYEKSQYNLQESIMKRKSIFIFVYMYFSIECPSNTIILSSSTASSKALCVSL